MIEFDETLFEQFEYRQEPDDDLETFDETLGETSERHAPESRQLVDEFLNGFSDAHTNGVDVIHAHGRNGFRGHRPDVGGSQIIDIDPLEEVGGQFEVALVETGTARNAQCGIVEEFGQDVRRVFERLAVEQSSDEEVPFLPQREFVVEIDIGVLGQQAFALEFDEGGGDQEELGGDLQIEMLQFLDLGEVGIDDARKGDLVQIDLLSQNEMEQEIERTLENGRLNLVWHRVTLEASDGVAVHYEPSCAVAPRRLGESRPPLPLRPLASRAMTRVFSGIKPTGPVQLGNLLGALRHWVADQDEADTIFCVVDLHALTVPQDPAELRSRTLELAQLLIAIGIDPQRSTLFVQSHVPEHAELSWLMECTASFGELRRMTQFKDKSDGAEFVSAGLFTYPALMAADILLYDTDRVPVGDDQKQHLELARDLAIRFNNRYGDTFVVPEPAIAKVGARVMDLQHPTKKMSKSEDSPQGTILVLEDLDAVTKKIKRAVTDTETDVRFDPAAKPGVSNLLSILSACTNESPDALAESYTRYGDLKAAVAEAVVETLRPIQLRYAELAADPGGTAALLATGAEKARSIASAVLDRARTAIGLLPPRE